MRRSIRTSVAACAVIAAAGSGCGADDAPSDVNPDGPSYVAELEPVAGSGVRGSARLTVGEGVLRARVDAQGLAANRIHAQEVRGFDDRRAARCPADTADDRDGRTLVELSPYPTVPDDGRLEYRSPVPAGDVDPEALADALVVLYGAEKGGVYHAHTPVACGTLKRAGASGASPATSGSERDGPRRTTAFRDAAAGFAVSYPRSWVRLPTAEPDARLLAAAPGGASVLVRASRLGAGAAERGMAALGEYTRRLVGQQRDVRLLGRGRRIEIAGLPGFAYVYTFADVGSGRRGAHSHLFLFDRGRMFALVFQAVPAAGFDAAAPQFDAIAASFRRLQGAQ